MTSYYSQPGTNPQYQPQNANPNYGWAPQPNAPPPPREFSFPSFILCLRCLPSLHVGMHL